MSDKQSPSAPAEQKILFQRYFRSVGPRTYAAQVKEAGNGNHFIVLTEGRRDEKTGEVRKTKLLVFSEDFEAFVKMFNETARFIQAHPISPEIQKRQKKFWARQAAKQKAEPAAAGAAAR